MNKNLISLPLSGLYEIKRIPFIDSRGSFLNIFRGDEEDFTNSWGEKSIMQINISLTNKKGSIRGLHYQRDEFNEAKIIRCISGKVWDVAVDLRKESRTYAKWHGIELSPDKNNSFLIPNGFAHGFQVLSPNTTLVYIHSKSWNPDYETGIRWDDPKLKIKWPIKITEISEKDKNLPYLQ